MYKDKDFLQFLYHTEEYSLRDIAKISGYSQQSILKWFRELEIPTRTSAESKRTERFRAKRRAIEKGKRHTRESRKKVGEAVKRHCERKRAEGNHFHRESLPSIEEI